MHRRVAYAAFAAGLLAATAACAPITTYSGFQAIEANPKDVKVGTDTKSTVRASLGSPSATSTFDPNVWFYVDQVKERVAFRRPVITSRNVVAITFDKDSEVVRNVDTLTLKDGRVIAFNGRETPTRGRELTILEQLLGNVGRGTMLPNQDENIPGNRPGDRR
ncbi:MAG: outer membrane protein assembly factor BamE [Phenylobacterium sp.]|jgi:outer membrane protein assembly factor BamE (lipoprotein component of BamABCDE complex)|uniref:outer membrane protein assembly factor BamE n=1 Tax=Phenylobacterium sp. TaxID=1871053 RepID=UPI00391956CE